MIPANTLFWSFRRGWQRNVGALYCVIGGLTGVGLAGPVTERPNIVVILADDLGYGDVSTYGSRSVDTPNIDRFAAEGMLFTSMRANATVCSPTRAALLTGRYADRVGVPGVIRENAEDSWGYLDPKAPTLATHLKEVGYHTAIVGKWHLGLTAPNIPNERGFDYFHGFLGDMMDSYITHLRHGKNFMRRNRETISPTGHATDLFTTWACDYIRERAGSRQPFFLYLPYNAPHFPIDPPPGWLARTRARWPELNEKRARNVALVGHLDDGIGQVLAALQAAGIARTTLVIITSDNGGSLPHVQNNDPWRDGKQSHYDGGLRVLFAIRWPGRVPAASRSDYAGLTFDAFATSLDAAGVKRPAEMDAVSLLPILDGGSPLPAGRDLYFVRREGGLRYGGKSYEAIIRGDWKLMQNDPYTSLELYNLSDDPQEEQNVLTLHPTIARDLQTALRAHIQRGGATPWQAPRTRVDGKP